MSSPWKFSVAISKFASNEYPSILRGDYEDTIIKAKQIGFDAVEIHCQNPSEIPIDLIKNICDSEGMEISAISSGLSYASEKLSITSIDYELRQKAKKRFKEYIDLASHFNSCVIMGLMRGQLDSQSQFEEISNVLKETLGEILKYAAEKEVVVLLEAINRYENNFFRSVGDIKNFVKLINNDYFRCHIDTYHMNIEECDCVNAVYSVDKWLGYVHFSDSNRRIPGLGHINFYSIARALYNINYRGYITVESLPFPDDHTAAELSFTYLKNLEKSILL